MTGKSFVTLPCTTRRPPLQRLRKEPFRPHRGSAHARVVANKEVAHFVDAREDDPGYVARDPFVVAAVEIAGIRTLVVVPMLKNNELIGTITIYRQEVRPFTGKQIELVSNFARQAVIAIENTRLLNELRESLSAANGNVGGTAGHQLVAGRYLEPVFNAMLENATRICEAKFGTLFSYDGNLFHCAAVRDAPPDLIDLYRRRGPFRPPPGTSLDRLLKTREVVNLLDDSASRYRALRPGLQVRSRILRCPCLRTKRWSARSSSTGRKFDHLLTSR